MICWKCGAKNPEGSRFCNKCGAVLDQKPGINGNNFQPGYPNGQYQNNNVNRMNPENGNKVNPGYAYRQYQNNNVTQRKPAGGSKKKLIIALILIAAAVVALIIGCIAFFKMVNNAYDRFSASEASISAERSISARNSIAAEQEAAEKAKRTMPNIIGMNIEQAKEALSEVGCTANVKEDFSERDPGTVLSAEVSAGTDLKNKTSVDVVVSKGSVQRFIDTAEPVSYDDLLRYPESYKSKAVKLDVEITQVETFGVLGVSVVEYYWGSCEGNVIKLYDKRDVEEPTIVKGDKLTICGYGDGTVLVGTSEKEEIDIPLIGTISYDTMKDSYSVPCVNFVYAEVHK